ncbi:MAG: hypothetical protein WEC84_05000 [Candidatus Andersenbacteria bacterium]
MLLPLITLVLALGIPMLLFGRLSALGQDRVKKWLPLIVLGPLSGSMFAPYWLGQALPKTWVHDRTAQLRNPWKGDGCSAVPYLLIAENVNGGAMHSWYEKGERHPTVVQLSADELLSTEVVEEAARKVGELRVFRAEFTENPALAWFAIPMGRIRYEFHLPLGGAKQVPY